MWRAAAGMVRTVSRARLVSSPDLGQQRPGNGQALTGAMPTASQQVPAGAADDALDGWRSAPGLDTELLTLLQATAGLELEDVAVTYRPGTG